jgi:hypothetical protein
MMPVMVHLKWLQTIAQPAAGSHQQVVCCCQASKASPDHNIVFACSIERATYMLTIQTMTAKKSRHADCPCANSPAGGCDAAAAAAAPAVVQLTVLAARERAEHCRRSCRCIGIVTIRDGHTDIAGSIQVGQLRKLTRINRCK